LIGLLEVVFWAPFFVVPIIAKRSVGEPLRYPDIVACVFISAVLAVTGSYFGRFQMGYRIALFPILGLGSLVVTGITLAKQGRLDPFVMLAIIDTNQSEATEFAGRYGIRDVALGAMLLAPVAALVIQATWHLSLPPIPYAGTALTGLFVAQMGAGYLLEVRLSLQTYQSQAGTLERFWRDVFLYPERYPPLQPYAALAWAMQMRREIASIARTAEPLPAVQTLERADRFNRTYVIVVGESLTRRHMHLYGYARDTTPSLDGLAAAGDLLAFRDVVTSHALTVPALSAIFRFAPGRGHDGHTLFDALNGAGFDTYWISNQYQYGIHEGAVSLLTSATTQVWLNQPLGAAFSYRNRRNFDSDVLPALQKLLLRNDKDKFVFVHLAGSHEVYAARYPVSAEYFTSLEQSGCRSPDQLRTINEYDNSVRFNDSVIGQIVEAVRGAGDESFVLYFSDHGEEVYEFRDYHGHSNPMLSPYMAEIPFILWLSDEYRRRHPEFVSRLGDGLDRPYVTSDLLYGISELARLTFPGMDVTRSIFSESFVSRPRMTADRDYDSFKRSWAPDASHAAPAPLIKCESSARGGKILRR
jgi:glucan phosphoethanolaminetransferase (alkaline phosphatase superfamily)